MNYSKYNTRLERILDMPLADDAIRQWPQSGELVRSSQRINEVESHFQGFKLGIGRRMLLDDKLVVEWTSDYGDGKLHRNVTIAEIEDGKAKKVTDYWGEPFSIPSWRTELTERIPESSNTIWPSKEQLIGDDN
ncbi:MAG: hypothetical protein KDC81_13540 [Flavobacteriaceae bacterium]|uniref:hypothetical protein n=1 Tax=Gelidibacter japonicus TaxID=1962232 RepID=UPI001D4F751B|nr:hypothetical protein [Flavobacteriaceae bacterium]